MSEHFKNWAIRGATTIINNTSDEIKEATLELLSTIIKENNLDQNDITTAFFTVTPDINAEFPAKFARMHLGWSEVPMVCAQEIPVAGSLPLCIRVIILINTTKQRNEMKHVYLRNAQKLRPDLCKK